MIDEKGRLFGKINIVDLLVVLVIIIAAVFVGMKFLGGGSGTGGAVSGGKTRIVYTVLVENVRPEVYENVKACVDAGDATLMASGEMLDGRVTDVTAAPHEESISVSSTGNAVIIPVGKGHLDLTFTIECNVLNTITTEIGTQEVRIGKTHIVKTDKFELAGGVILSCQRGEDAA